MQCTSHVHSDRLMDMYLPLLCSLTLIPPLFVLPAHGHLALPAHVLAWSTLRTQMVAAAAATAMDATAMLLLLWRLIVIGNAAMTTAQAWPMYASQCGVSCRTFDARTPNGCLASQVNDLIVEFGDVLSNIMIAFQWPLCALDSDVGIVHERPHL